MPTRNFPDYPRSGFFYLHKSIIFVLIKEAQRPKRKHGPSNNHPILPIHLLERYLRIRGALVLLPN